MARHLWWAFLIETGSQARCGKPSGAWRPAAFFNRLQRDSDADHIRGSVPKGTPFGSPRNRPCGWALRPRFAPADACGGECLRRPHHSDSGTWRPERELWPTAGGAEALRATGLRPM
jgi:hypothetical protein